MSLCILSVYYPNAQALLTNIFLLAFAPQTPIICMEMFPATLQIFAN